MKRFIFAALLALAACNDMPQSSDQKQHDAQEKILAEGTSQLGMPAIVNFNEKRLLKSIMELRDQTGLATYTYTFSEVTGKPSFFCNSLGYGIPYATQYTSPGKPYGGYQSYTTLPQADPNGLFSPASAEGTWIMCQDPNGKNVTPVYVEPRVIVTQFKLP